MLRCYIDFQPHHKGMYSFGHQECESSNLPCFHKHIPVSLRLSHWWHPWGRWWAPLVSVACFWENWTRSCFFFLALADLPELIGIAGLVQKNDQYLHWWTRSHQVQRLDSRLMSKGSDMSYGRKQCLSLVNSQLLCCRYLCADVSHWSLNPL